VLPLVLIVFGITKANPARRRSIWFFVVMAGVVILKNAGVPPFIWIGHLPIFDQVWSQRYGSPVWTFCLTVAAGLAVDVLFPREASLKAASPSPMLGLRETRAASITLLYLLILPTQFLSILAVWNGAGPIAWGLTGLLALVILYTAGSEITWFPEVLKSTLHRFIESGASLRSLAISVAVIAPVLGFVSTAIILPLIPPGGGILKGIALGIALFAPATMAGISVIVGARKASPYLADRRYLVVALILSFGYALALAWYPAIGPVQRPFFAPMVIGGAVVSITTAALGVWLVNRRIMDRFGLFALIVLAIGELTFALARGYPSTWVWWKLGAWALGLAAVWGLATRRITLVGVGLTVSLVGYIVIDYTAESGYPDRSDPFARPPYVDFVNEQPGRARIAGSGGILMPNFASAFGLSDVRYIQSLAVQTKHHFIQNHLQDIPLLRGNSLWFTGIPVTRFTDLSPGISLWYRDFAKWYPHRPYFIKLAVERAKFGLRAKYKAFGLLGVRYFVLPNWTDLNPPTRASAVGQRPRFPLIYDAEVRIFENPTAVPRAFIVHDVLKAPDFIAAQEIAGGDTFKPLKQGVVEDEFFLEAQQPIGQMEPSTAKVISDGLQTVEIETKSRSHGLLVLADMHYPGWEAEIDGQSVPVLRVNGLVRGIWLPPGTHNVRFMYRPLSFEVGLWIAAATVLVLIVLLLPWCSAKRSD
jgi:hypothetical protein